MVRISKTDRDNLRAAMLAERLPVEAVQAEFVRRWGMRPREAWRHAHGWSLSAMAVAYNSRFDTTGRAPMSASRLGAYERWPDSKERPSLTVLQAVASLVGTSANRLVDARDWQHMPESDRRAFENQAQEADNPAIEPTRVHPPREHARQSVGAAYGGYDDAGLAQAEVVAMAAHEGSEFAEQAERREVGDATLEQLRAEIIALSEGYLTGEPLAVFIEMRRVRRRIYRVLDKKLWPNDSRDLYFLLGVLNGLMATAANALGNIPAAEELIRAGWAYAVAIQHKPLMAHLRMELAAFTFWERPRQSRAFAASGLEYLNVGPNGAQLYLKHANAAAKLGDTPTTRASVRQAHQARATDHHDDMLDLGGQFGVSLATHHWLAGEALLAVPDARDEAMTELQEATRLYALGPGPGEAFSTHCIHKARVDMATLQLTTGNLDAAQESLRPVLSLPPAMRVASLTRRLGRIRTTLAEAPYGGELLATQLDEEIEEFGQTTITTDLAELTPPPTH